MTNKYSAQINQLGASLGVIALSISQLSQQVAEANFNLLKLATDINDGETVTLKIEVDTSAVVDAIDGILGQLGVVAQVVEVNTSGESEGAAYNQALSILTQRIVTAQKEVHQEVMGADERLKRDTKLADDLQGGFLSGLEVLAYLTRQKTWDDLYGVKDPNDSDSGASLGDILNAALRRQEEIDAGDGDADISEVVEKPVEPKISAIDAQVMEVLEGRRERPVPEELVETKPAPITINPVEEVALIDGVDAEVSDKAVATFPVEGESDDFASALAAAELAETVDQAVVKAPVSEGVDYSIGGGFYHNKLTEVDAAGLLQFAHKHYGTTSFTADALFQNSYNRGQKKVRDDAGFRVTGRGPVYLANLIDFLDALAGNTFKASIGDNPNDARKLTLVKDGAYSYQIIDGGNL